MLVPSPTHVWLRLHERGVFRGQTFEASGEQYMKQHIRTEKRLASAKSAWGETADLEAVKTVFCTFLDGSAPSPWSEAAPDAAAATLTSKLKAIISKGYLPTNALPMARPCQPCVIG